MMQDDIMQPLEMAVPKEPELLEIISGEATHTHIFASVSCVNSVSL